MISLSFILFELNNKCLKPGVEVKFRGSGGRTKGLLTECLEQANF